VLKKSALYNDIYKLRKPCKISELLGAVKELSQKIQYPGRGVIEKNSGAVVEPEKIASDNMTCPSKSDPNLELVF